MAHSKAGMDGDWAGVDGDWAGRLGCSPAKAWPARGAGHQVLIGDQPGRLDKWLSGQKVRRQTGGQLSHSQALGSFEPLLRSSR